MGKGLDALLGEYTAAPSEGVHDVDIALIDINREQPRKQFDDERLAELSESIKLHGIVQPIIVKRTNDRYMIVAGERRYRAARLAGLTTVPAIIRDFTDSEIMEVALIENIQREDLNAIEIALTFRKLIDQYKLTQERLSERIGKKRATIANFLRLLKLPAEVQIGLRDRKVDMGHARALLSLDKAPLQLKLYNEIIKKGLSVRQVEAMAKQLQEREAAAEGEAQVPERQKSNRDYDILKKHLNSSFKTPVKLSVDASGKGKITFSFKNDEELENLIRIFDKLKVE